MSEHSHKQAIPNDLLLLAAPELLSFAEIVHKILQIVRVELLQRLSDNFNQLFPWFFYFAKIQNPQNFKSNLEFEAVLVGLTALQKMIEHKQGQR